MAFRSGAEKLVSLSLGGCWESLRALDGFTLYGAVERRRLLFPIQSFITRGHAVLPMQYQGCVPGFSR